MKIRIQKILAEMGVASRRAIEEMIAERRIDVNGKTVTKLPCFIESGVDEIRVDGEVIKQKKPDKKVYFLVNKAKNVVCTSSDDLGRKCIIDMIPEIPQRVYCVGRLDKESTGVILLTNDGELTEKLTHPRYGVTKTYVVEIDGKLTAEDVAKLKSPMYLDGKRTQGTAVKILHNGFKSSMVEIKLREGKNREIRRVLLRLGHKVTKLKRTAIGPITDNGLKVGSFRMLKPSEIGKLEKMTKKLEPTELPKKKTKKVRVSVNEVEVSPHMDTGKSRRRILK